MDALEDGRDEALLQAVVLAAVEGQPHLVGADRILSAHRHHRHARGREGAVVAGRIGRIGHAVEAAFGAQAAQRLQHEGRLRPIVLAIHDRLAIGGDIGVDDGGDPVLAVFLKEGLGAQKAQLFLVGEDEDEAVGDRLAFQRHV